jgi:serine/threonine-protein kinase
MSLGQPHLKPGTILAGRWQIQEFIGGGETGEVYGVRDMHGVSSFALKLFWPSALEQAEVWSAVQQTVRTASGLGVDGVARAYDFGIDANSARPFFVTERVSWSSLADRVRVHGPLTPAEMSTALVVLTRTLEGAHAAGVVHRDLKPENVFVSKENANWVRVSDFGVALLRSASPPPPGWGGTIGWVSPDAADLKARSTPAMDIFSLGLVTFFALSGGALHRAARGTPIDPRALWAELNAPLDSASLRARELGAALDEAFDPWFRRAVAPSPQQRFSSVAEMASAFHAIVRTLIAPQSQNAVALPGIAAAIAQPLLFQLDAPRSAPEHAPAPSPTEPNPALVAAVGTPAPEELALSIPAARKNAAPLLIGGAVVLFAATGLGFAALYQRHSPASESVMPASTASPVEPGSAASVAANPPPPPTEISPPARPSAATVTVTPVATESAAPESTAVATATSKALLAPKPAASPTARPAATAAAKSSIAVTKPAASAGTAPKPASKPSPITPPKKKCGSTFIPCK